MGARYAVTEQFQSEIALECVTFEISHTHIEGSRGMFPRRVPRAEPLAAGGTIDIQLLGIHSNRDIVVFNSKSTGQKPKTPTQRIAVRCIHGGEQLPDDAGGIVSLSHDIHRLLGCCILQADAKIQARVAP